jgi:hypothetical protein
MTFTKLILALACLMSGTLVAQEAKVTQLLSKDLTNLPGKEGLMITVEYPPGSSDPIHRHNAASRVENRRSDCSLPVVIGRGFRRVTSVRFGLVLFPVPAHRTGLAVFPHPALGKDSRFRPRKVRGPVW